jgi:hypothetical protein
MLTWGEVLAHYERYNDLQREADGQHRVARVLPRGEASHSVGDQVMAWVGRRLVSWGCALQEKYQTAATGGDSRVCQPQPTSR